MYQDTYRGKFQAKLGGLESRGRQRRESVRRSTSLNRSSLRPQQGHLYDPADEISMNSKRKTGCGWFPSLAETPISPLCSYSSSPSPALPQSLVGKVGNRGWQGFAGPLLLPLYLFIYLFFLENKVYSQYLSWIHPVYFMD